MLLPPLPSIIKSLNSKPTPLPPPPSTPPPPPPQSNITSHNHHHHNRKETADLKTTTTTTTNPVKSNQHFVDADNNINKRPTKTLHISSTNNKSPTPVNIEGKSPSFDDRHVRSNVEFSKRYFFFLLHSIVVYTHHI